MRAFIANAADFSHARTTSYQVWASVLLLLGILLQSCVEDPQTEPPADAAGEVEVTDVGGTPDFVNACDGLTPLNYEGESAAPGESCGACDDGTLECAGPEALECVGETAANTCGGCDPLELVPGTSCGPCDNGVVRCDDSGGSECRGAGTENDCGGCAELDGTPGESCGTTQDPATWQCVSDNRVQCIEEEANDCGGQEELTYNNESASPDDPCGACGEGTLQCADINTLTCENPEEGLNQCNGCQPLRGVPDEPCGEFGGVWTCDDGRTICSRQRNTCGGVRILRYQGEEASAGDSCGPCDEGVLACAGEEALECIESTELNACEGCGTLEDLPGTPCGPCELGSWTCNEGGTAVQCLNDREVNACGGCEVLGTQPGGTCGTDRNPGIWQCVSAEQVRCVETDANACGGEAELEQSPGELCGACNRGTLVCDGLNALACANQDAGLNACDGCQPLAGQPGESCGSCPEAEWECQDDGTVACSTIRNDCGGCEPLGATPGESCNDGEGVISCDGRNATACEATNLNACGGEAELDNIPGTDCGPCFEGSYACVGKNAVSCIGSTTQNACGGCGTLEGAPGEFCAPNAVFVCDGGQVACSVDLGLNACGGTSPLDRLPNETCGPCDEGTVACAGANATRCDGETPEEALIRWPDTDDDGFGDPDGETIQTCTEQLGYVDNDDDCNDEDDRYYPGAEEPACPGNIDFNCDGEVNYVDGDNDGSPECLDCNDSNSNAYPGADEVCDGIDNDCNELVDDGVGPNWFLDEDGDGFGIQADKIRSCSQPEGYAENSGDCKPQNEDINPAATEVCDGVDNDCNGTADGPDAQGQTEWFPDNDGDGFGDGAGQTITSCSQPEGYVAITEENPRDCNDGDEDVFPGAEEVCDGIDNNCDNVTDDDATDQVTVYTDADGDGYGDPSTEQIACPADGLVEDGTDCNDNRDDVYPGADEIVGDGVDQNCDEEELCYLDVDGDGYLADFDTVVATDSMSCNGTVECPDGSLPGDGTFDDDHLCSLSNGDNATLDCDDTDVTAFPGAPETFGDGIDSNCDGTEVCFRDADNDGYRPSASAIVVSSNASCDDPGEADEFDPLGDCFDANAPIEKGGYTLRPEDFYPGATENGYDGYRVGVDNNCNGRIFCYRDSDEDNYRGTSPAFKEADYATDPDFYADLCSGETWKTGKAPIEGDLCDNYADRNPAQAEVCDGIDNDCDNLTDINDSDVEGTVTAYTDNDGDTYGSSSYEACPAPGLVTRGGDCNDSDADVNPGESEVCNYVDDDCNGLEDDNGSVENALHSTVWFDGDGDGWGGIGEDIQGCAIGNFVDRGEDCDDRDEFIYPDKVDDLDGGKDENCDGRDGMYDSNYSSVRSLYVGGDSATPDTTSCRLGDGSPYTCTLSEAIEDCSDANNCNGILFRPGVYERTEDTAFKAQKTYFGGYNETWDDATSPNDSSVRDDLTVLTIPNDYFNVDGTYTPTQPFYIPGDNTVLESLQLEGNNGVHTWTDRIISSDIRRNENNCRADVVTLWVEGADALLDRIKVVAGDANFFDSGDTDLEDTFGVVGAQGPVLDWTSSIWCADPGNADTACRNLLYAGGTADTSDIGDKTPVDSYSDVDWTSRPLRFFDDPGHGQRGGPETPDSGGGYENGPGERDGYAGGCAGASSIAVYVNSPNAVGAPAFFSSTIVLGAAQPGTPGASRTTELPESPGITDDDRVAVGGGAGGRGGSSIGIAVNTYRSFSTSNLTFERSSRCSMTQLSNTCAGKGGDGGFSKSYDDGVSQCASYPCTKDVFSNLAGYGEDGKNGDEYEIYEFQ